MRDLTDDDINDMVGKAVKEIISTMDDQSIRLKPLTEDEYSAALKTAKETEEKFKRLIGMSEYSSVAEMAREAIKDRDLHASDDSLVFKRLCRDILKGCLHAAQTRLKILSGDYSFEQKQQEEPQHLLSYVIEKYLHEMNAPKNWNEKTGFEVSSSLRLLLEFVGDIPVGKIEHATMRKYKEALMRLPPNRSKMPQYRGKTVHELMRMKIDNPLSITSVNKYLRWASTLFLWAVRNGFMSKNPAEGMKVKQPKKDHEFRDAFDQDDLRKIFHSPEYIEDLHSESYAFWVPIIALFTGARLNEICQLYLDDIYQEKGIWLFDFNKNTPDKKLKTKAAKRRVPLHPFLRDVLNLQDYAESLRAKGQVRLFPELKLGREGYGTTVSKWFARYRKSRGIDVKPPAPKKDFHSFRDTAANCLKQAGVDDTMINEVIGHANTSMSITRYADPYYPGVLLKKAISKLDYGIDLSHLNGKKYIGNEGP